MKARRYDAAKDAEAACRVFAEVGWLDVEKDKHVKAHEEYLAAAETFVGDLKGEPECVVTACQGTLRYLDTDLGMCCVTGVATSRVGRKRGLSSRTTALAVAEGAAKGLEVSGLGMFEQGFYDRLGFGTGSYVIEYRFDPASLNVKGGARVPERLGAGDAEAVFRSRLGSLRRHGSATVSLVEQVRLRTADESFGLGYRGEDGRITHHIWLERPARESGPLQVRWWAFETLEEFMELMALLKGLSDQYRTVVMSEPAGVQMQDLIRTPYRYAVSRESGAHRTGARASAFWQVRMNDIPACLRKTHLSCEELRFNAQISDPIGDYLDEDAPWRGAGGDFVVTLGRDSKAEAGCDSSLPGIVTTVNAFSRMWLGVLPATTLRVTDDFSGPGELLDALDGAFILPRPDFGWYF